MQRENRESWLLGMDRGRLTNCVLEQSPKEIERDKAQMIQFGEKLSKMTLT